jgi:FMN-dependent NADH-azoreductase
MAKCDSNMNKLLYIEASPLGDRSDTSTVANAFLRTYHATNPDHAIERIELWRTSMPAFDSQTIEAKFAVLRRKEFSPEQLERWDALRAFSRRFNSADKYVFSLPMWNFGVPYVLKHYIDIVTLPGENWTWSKAHGYGTIFAGKKALLIYASANRHEQKGPRASDFQKPFMRHWLRFIGVHDVREIDIAPTLAEPDELALSRSAAMSAATQLAATF